MKKHLWQGSCIIISNSGDIDIPLTGASSGELVFAKTNYLSVATYSACASSRRSLEEVFENLKSRADLTSFTTSYKKVY